jgi:hypothetical protein
MTIPNRDVLRRFDAEDRATDGNPKALGFISSRDCYAIAEARRLALMTLLEAVGNEAEARKVFALAACLWFCDLFWPEGMPENFGRWSLPIRELSRLIELVNEHLLRMDAGHQVVAWDGKLPARSDTPAALPG